MRQALMGLVVAFAAMSCSILRPQPVQDSFEVFFVPGSTTLTSEAQTLIRVAAQNARTLSASRIDISVPPDAPGISLTEGRFTAIQNIFSAAGTDSRILQRTSFSDMAIKLPGAANRAEVRLLKTSGNR